MAALPGRPHGDLREFFRRGLAEEKVEDSHGVLRDGDSSAV